MSACNRRYLDFLSAVDDPTNRIKKVNKLSRSVTDAGRSYRGFNLFIEVCIANDPLIPAVAWKSGLPLEALRSLAMQGSITSKTKPSSELLPKAACKVLASATAACAARSARQPGKYREFSNVFATLV